MTQQKSHSDDADVTALYGVHHVRLPVANLDKTYAWYRTFLGYRRDFDFKNGDQVIGWALKHDQGGPDLVLMHDPGFAQRTAGFAFFSLCMQDETAVRTLAARLDAAGVRNGGVHSAFVKVKLTQVEDPDGHLIGFYVKGERERQPT